MVKDSGRLVLDRASSVYAMNARQTDGQGTPAEGRLQSGLWQDNDHYGYIW
jgi:hypothetical protein